jgi:hypothetical protein
MISFARRRFVPVLVLLLLPLGAQALPPAQSAPLRHYILESDVPLDAAASAELAAEGIDVQRTMANHRYLVRIRDGAEGTHDARIRSLRKYDASQKIARAAYAEAATGKAFARLRILFQKDVTFEDARAAIEAVGGTIDLPLDAALSGPQRLTVHIPSSATQTLAQDERVFGVYGPPLHVRALNAVAAQLSNVTPLYSAPYNLTGDGVVLSIFEPEGHPDGSHPEFGGRLTSHFDAGRPVDSHATHTSGTMIAAGLNAAAKGMSPAATLHAFDANPSLPNGDFDSVKLFSTKRDDTKAAGSVADNNSWDFALSWQAGNIWYGSEDAYGAYSGLESEPYDAVMRTTNEPLIVHAAGNDADAGNPSLGQWGVHKHIEDQSPSGAFPHTYCYSKDGTGRDCPTAVPFSCSAGVTYCETVKHATHGANTTIGLMASTKNSVAVGAIQPIAFAIAPFSSRGPTTDGRIKPELVAKGTDQFSTFPGNSYASIQGTSMAAPVVAGIAGILTQQYRKTFGRTPGAPILKTLLIAGADDLGKAGPDYTFGFGLADAKASVDLIRDDNGTGSRIRTGTVANGQEIDIPIALAAAQKLRVVLGWFDPEVLLQPNPQPDDDDLLADKTLVNDLDLRVVDASGVTTFPYVLSPATPDAVATRGVNHTDTTEEVEIASALPGTYHIIVHGAIGDSRSSSQDFVLVTTGGTPVVPCTDFYEPNDSEGTAFQGLVSDQAIQPRICSAGDVDYFTVTTSSISVTVAAGDTPLKVTLSTGGSAFDTKTIPANGSATVAGQINSLVAPAPSVPFFLRVEANGTLGPNGTYTVTPHFAFTTVPRKRSTKH